MLKIVESQSAPYKIISCKRKLLAGKYIEYEHNYASS